MLRFAPSPTGDMSLNTLRIAIINYLVAQQKNDQLLVRIEDIDTQHNIEGKDTEIMMILEKFALKHDSVFHQSEHLNLYHILILKLLKEKKAFLCTCNDKTVPYLGHCEHLSQDDYSTLKASGKKFVIRIKKPEQNIDFNDLIQKEITCAPSEIDAFIILNEERKPSYNFACAADDMMSDINFVIRDKQYLINTPQQIHIKNLLGYEEKTDYAHLGSISNINEAPSLQSLFEEGYLPDAILNYLILIANPKAPQKVFTLPEAIEWFNLSNISKTSTPFELTKLRFINREHLKLMEDKKLSTLFGFADADIGKLAKVYLKECSTIQELQAKITPIFKGKNFNEKEGQEMKIIADLIASAPAFETFDRLTQYITKESGLKGEKLEIPLRKLLTGTGNSSPKLSEIYPYIKSYILEVAS